MTDENDMSDDELREKWERGQPVGLWRLLPSTASNSGTPDLTVSVQWWSK